MHIQGISMIRSAKKEEADILTQISYKSKEYWNYPQAYFEVWNRELTITSDYIEKNDVFVFELDGAVVGYYSLVELSEDIEVSGITIKKGFWLEHMFIWPENIGNGIGTKMFAHLRKRCILRGINELGILADPNARGFYEKMGCVYKHDYPSTVENRTIPYLQKILSDFCDKDNDH
jgi:GNAT superfamily N-acetyltransferase